METDSSMVIPLDVKEDIKLSTVTAGEGSLASASLKLQVLESFLPSGTWIHGPPVKDTATLAANTMISAQETCPGHSSSNTDFIWLIISLFLIPKFLEEIISELYVVSNKIEASQPYS